MASGIDPKLTALIERLALKFSWLDPQYGIHAGQKPDQTVRVELGDGLIIVFSVRRDNWTAIAIGFDGHTPRLNNEVTEKVKGTDLAFLWAVTRIRTTYRDVAGMLRVEDPSTAEWLDRQLERLNADLVRPLS